MPSASRFNKRMRGTLIACLLLLGSTVAVAQTATLPPGKRIQLICQRTISTHPKGGVLGIIGVKPITREGTLMVFEVARDVYAEDGTLMIAAGAPATGSVIDAQVGGGIKPHAPRLAVTVDRVLTVDGEFLPLRFSTRHEGQWARVFSRAETGEWVNRNSDDAVEMIFAKPELNPAVTELFDLVVQGRVGDMFRSPVKVLGLDYVARQSGLPNFVRFLQENRILAVAQLIAEIQTGSFLLRSLTDLRRWYDAFRLLDETWKAGKQLTTWILGRVKAPQIVVPAGFPVEAVVSESTETTGSGNQFLQW